MCGIAGSYSFTQNNSSVHVIAMTKAITHRGPEAEGFYHDNTVSLGHRRLSIIDLSELSNQPLYDSTGNYCIIFNGEIFNYTEIKKELSDYNFKTNGDGEVVLAAFIKWGANFLHKLKGFFAFAIYNTVNEKLFIARDRLGVKPLYFFQNKDTFLFASEIRAILKTNIVPKKINMLAVQCYLHMQSFYAPNTIIEEIKQLQNGQYLTIENNQVTIKTWWDIKGKNEAIKVESNRETIQNDIYKLLDQSVQRRLVADVPVAAFLSGGIDSSAIVALMAQHKKDVATFNIAFEEKEYDESTYAEIIAKKFNTNHHKVLLSPNNFLEELPNALAVMDSPSADGINSYVVSKAIVTNGIKVAMSGVGGDELFAGYPGFSFWKKINYYSNIWKLPKVVRKIPSAFLSSNGKWGRVKEAIEMSNPDINNFYPLMRQLLSKKDIENITGINFSYSYPNAIAKNVPLISQYTIAELLGYTQQTLLKDTDQFSMAVALEVREPFFDTDLIEYVLQIPDDIKQPTFAKQLLVESLGDLLPKEIVHRPKKGFTFPWDYWLRNELNSFCVERIKSLSQRQEFNADAINKLWTNFSNKKNVRWPEVWQLVVLENWLQLNVD